MKPIQKRWAAPATRSRCKSLSMALALTLSTAAPSYANPFDRSARPVFEFKGAKAGASADLAGFKCKPGAVAKSLQCVPTEPLIAGRTVSGLTMNFYEGKFASLEFTGKPADFWPIGDAFVAKYGVPCLTLPNWLEIEGNTALNWCFRTGVLSLEQTNGRDRTRLRAFYYDDDVKTPPLAPKIDF